MVRQRSCISQGSQPTAALFPQGAQPVSIPCAQPLAVHTAAASQGQGNTRPEEDAACSAAATAEQHAPFFEQVTDVLYLQHIRLRACSASYQREATPGEDAAAA
jgi:hypothetical protein